MTTLGIELFCATCSPDAAVAIPVAVSVVVAALADGAVCLFSCLSLVGLTVMCQVTVVLGYCGHCH